MKEEKGLSNIIQTEETPNSIVCTVEVDPYPCEVFLYIDEMDIANTPQETFHMIEQTNKGTILYYLNNNSLMWLK